MGGHRFDTGRHWKVKLKVESYKKAKKFELTHISSNSVWKLGLGVYIAIEH